MITGMLWFSNDPKKTLADKVRQAAAYYKQKYGRVPDLCLVNPFVFKDLDATSASVEFEGKTITVRAWRSTLKDHLWLGVEEMPVEAVRVTGDD